MSALNPSTPVTSTPTTSGPPTNNLLSALTGGGSGSGSGGVSSGGVPTMGGAGLSSTAAISESEVDSFFRNFAEGAAPNATKNQKRRLVDSASTFWRSLVSAPVQQSAAGNPSGTPTTSGAPTSFRAAKEAGVILGFTQNEKTGLLNRPRSLALPQTIEIGKPKLSETEKWKLQAAMRREEQKASGEKYNQAMLRETKVCKGPTVGEAFPAGRGRPVK